MSIFRTVRKLKQNAKNFITLNCSTNLLSFDSSHHIVSLVLLFSFPNTSFLALHQAQAFRTITSKSSDSNAEFIRPLLTCPSDIESLSALMLRDLPAYGNRVSQRSRRSAQDIAPQSHIVTASVADIAVLGPSQYTTIPSTDDIRDQGLESIFFTTLERQYLSAESLLLQHYHWLFLVKISDGWAFAFMYSILGDYPSEEPPTPLRDSNQGIIAQAIRLWLRDCQAGSIEDLGE